MQGFFHKNSMGELVKESFDLLHRPLRIKGICVVKVTKPLDIFKISPALSFLQLFKNVKVPRRLFILQCNTGLLILTYFFLIKVILT